MSSPAIPESANLCHTLPGAVSHESKGRQGVITSSFEALAKAHYSFDFLTYVYCEEKTIRLSNKICKI